MANPIARDHLAGSTFPVTLGGTQYNVTPLGPGDFAALERHLRVERYAIHCEARASMPADEYERRARQLLSLPFSPQDIASQIESGPGMQFLLTRSIRKQHPDFDAARVDASVDEWKTAVETMLGISSTGDGDADPTKPASPAMPT